jgi:hypothetical protein
MLLNNQCTLVNLHCISTPEDSRDLRGVCGGPIAKGRELRDGISRWPAISWCAGSLACCADGKIAVLQCSAGFRMHYHSEGHVVSRRR